MRVILVRRNERAADAPWTVASQGCRTLARSTPMLRPRRRCSRSRRRRRCDREQARPRQRGEPGSGKVLLGGEAAGSQRGSESGDEAASRRRRHRHAVPGYPETAGTLGIPAGAIGVWFLAEHQLKAQGWLGKDAALLAGCGIAMVLVGPVAWLCCCWFRRSIESNAPWIDRLAPWAPRVIAAGLTLAIGVPTTWAAYAFTRPPPLVVHEYPNPAPNVHGAAAAMAGYRLLGHACLDAPPKQWWYESRPTRPDHPGCRRDDVYELALRIAGEIKKEVRANSERERLPHSTRAGAARAAP